jgi:hypothetical protein
MAWYDRLIRGASQFSAGVGDSLSLGGTWYVRQWMGVNYGIHEDDGWYRAGEYTETAAEIILTLGSGALKVGARKVAGEAARAAAEAEFRKYGIRALAGGLKRVWGETAFIHHINPLAGHPLQLTGFVVREALFPLRGLPGWIHSAERNLAILAKAEHETAHLRLMKYETIAKWVVNPITTSMRALRLGMSYLPNHGEAGTPFDAKAAVAPHEPMPLPSGRIATHRETDAYFDQLITWGKWQAAHPPPPRKFSIVFTPEDNAENRKGD